ncbi:hypothetical protein Tco_0534042, partial [Tanacetum coccineum]
MDQIKQIDETAYDYLIQINPNSWSRAFFEMDRRYAAFENGISESFSRAILGLRHKLIITMLEEIRLYIMQRLVAMNKIAFSLEDRITPSIRKRLEILKEKQRLWELSGVPCVHVVAAYMHVGTDLDLGVSFWYSQESWFNAYQFSIKPVFGSNMWKRTNDVPPKPPLLRKMLGRPQKGHNKTSCKADPQPKPTIEKKQPRRKKQNVMGQCASRGCGRRRGVGNEASDSGMGGIGEASDSGLGGIGEASGSGGRGGRTSSRGGERGRRGGGMGSRGGRRGSREG